MWIWTEITEHKQKIKKTSFMKLAVLTVKQSSSVSKRLKSRSDEHKRSVKNCDCE